MRRTPSHGQAANLPLSKEISNHGTGARTASSQPVPKQESRIPPSSRPWENNWDPPRWGRNRFPRLLNPIQHGNALLNRGIGKQYEACCTPLAVRYRTDLPRGPSRRFALFPEKSGKTRRDGRDPNELLSIPREGRRQRTTLLPSPIPPTINLCGGAAGRSPDSAPFETCPLPQSRFLCTANSCDRDVYRPRPMPLWSSPPRSDRPRRRRPRKTTPSNRLIATVGRAGATRASTSRIGKSVPSRRSSNCWIVCPAIDGARRLRIVIRASDAS